MSPVVAKTGTYRKLSLHVAFFEDMILMAMLSEVMRQDASYVAV